jgi:hypothetical protein
MGKSIFQRRTANLAPEVVTATAFTATSTAAVQIHPNGQGKYIVNLLPTQNCFIRFGTSSVGAATSNDWPLVANQLVRFVISNDTNYFTVIRNSADGTLDWYVVGRTS